MNAVIPTSMEVARLTARVELVSYDFMGVFLLPEKDDGNNVSGLSSLGDFSASTFSKAMATNIAGTTTCGKR